MNTGPGHPEHDVGPFSTAPMAPGRYLRAHSGGVLRAGDLPIIAKYVLDPATGCPVVPLAADGPDAIDESMADSLPFLIPDEGEGGLQLLCSVADLDPRTHESPDRHLIYHGPSHQRRWALLRVESARIANRVFDPQLLIAPNPLRSAEPGLCKLANGRKEHLLALARDRIGRSLDRAVMVGIDPLGLDVRTNFGIGRIEFTAPMTTPAAAHEAVETLLLDASKGLS